MNDKGIKSASREGTDIQKHRALSLESAKEALESGRILLAELKARDPEKADPEVIDRLEKVLARLAQIIRPARG